MPHRRLDRALPNDGLSLSSYREIAVICCCIRFYKIVSTCITKYLEYIDVDLELRLGLGAAQPVAAVVVPHEEGGRDGPGDRVDHEERLDGVAEWHDRKDPGDAEHAGPKQGEHPH